MFPHRHSSPTHLPPRFQGSRPGIPNLQHFPSSLSQQPSINSSRLDFSPEDMPTSPSLKFPPQVSSTQLDDSPRGEFKPQPDASVDEQSWQLHPLHGITHRFGCEICSAYTIHLYQSGKQPHFQKLMALKAEQQDALYTLGIKEGRRRQVLNDMFLHEERQALRNQLDEAVTAVVQNRAECDYLSQQLRLVQDQLTTSQAQTTSLRFPNKSEVVSTNSTFWTATAHRGGSSNSQTDSSGTVPSRFSRLAGRFSHDIHAPVSLTVEAKPLPLYATAVSAVASPSAFATPSIVSGSQAKFRSGPSMPMHHGNNAVRAPESLNTISSMPDSKSLNHLQNLLDQIRIPGQGVGTKYKAPKALEGSTSQVGRTGSQRTFHSALVATTESPGFASTPSIISDGASLPMAPGLQNPRLDDPVEAWYQYLCYHSKSWPLGVRQDPSTQRPNFLDLKASRIIARLRPDLDGLLKSASRRGAFMKTCSTFLSVSGAYQEWLNKNNYSISTQVSYTPYMGPASPLTNADVARHLADCGIGPPDVHALEKWAKNYVQDLAARSRFVK